MVLAIIGGLALVTLSACVMSPNNASTTSAPSETDAAACVPSKAPRQELILDFGSSYAAELTEQVFDTESSVYYLCREDNEQEVIYISDKEYKDWMPLCGRPNCMHDDENCDAWLEGSTLGCKIWPFDEHIYYLIDNNKQSDSVYELWRMKLDGTEHEMALECRNLSAHDDPSARMTSWFFHGRYAILTFSEMSEDSVERSCSVIDLSKKPLEQVPLDLPIWAFKIYAGDGDIVYGVDPMENNSLYSIDLLSQTTRKLCELPFYPDFSGCQLIDSVLYFSGGIETGMLASFDTVTEKLTVFENTLPVGYWYTMHAGFIIATDVPLEGEKRGTMIYDLEGNLIRAIPYSEYGTDIMVSRAAGNLIFGADCSNGDLSEISYNSPPEYYIDLSQIGAEGFGWMKWGSEL